MESAWSRWGMVCVGLTDRPDRSRQEHGDPTDWRQAGPFENEAAARTWERATLAALGSLGQAGRDRDGWRYGYVYTFRPRRVRRRAS